MRNNRLILKSQQRLTSKKHSMFTEEVLTMIIEYNQWIL